MSYTKNPLNDSDFLKQLDEYRYREVHAKIITLNWAGNPVEEIQGKIISGSINVDGSSAIRRTCSLNITTNLNSDEIDMTDLNWALKTKFTVYIGLTNFINTDYDDVIWFPQGEFILTSYTKTLNTQGYTIQIQGKDKMCLLNGDVGGQLFASHDFGKITLLHDDGTEEVEQVSIYKIIRNAIHDYAMEPYENIVINDIDSCAVSLISYRAKEADMFVYETENKGVWIQNIVFGDSTSLGKFFTYGFESEQLFDVEGGTLIDSDTEYTYNGDTISNPIAAQIHLIKRCRYGDTAGYELTSLTYTGDLTIAVGGTITQMLDKIIQMLGEFEYFYDLDGKFVFQRKRIYYNSSWSNVVTHENETYYDSAVGSSAYSYKFLSGKIIESFANKPVLTAIKNDFSIWGSLKSVSNTDLPIHIRYAIDDKPKEYYSLTYKKLYTARYFNYDTNQWVGNCDWRELIYLMAIDFAKSQNKIAEFEAAYIGTLDYADQGESNIYYHLVSDNNTISINDNNLYFYYDTEIGFVKIELYEYPIYQGSDIDIFQMVDQQPEDMLEMSEAWRNTWNTGYDAYYADMQEFWPLLYSTHRIYHCETMTVGNYNALISSYDKFTAADRQEALSKITPANLEIYNSLTSEDSEFVVKRYELGQEEFNKWVANKYWNPNYFYCDPTDESYTAEFINPDLLIFWFDFLDENSGLDAYKVSVIGRRAKSVNDSDVKSIIFREVPSLLFVNPKIDEDVVDTGYVGYTRINIPTSIWNYLSISTQGKSAKEALDSMIYDCTYYQESVTLSTLPIYYLQPNTRIQVYNKEAGIDSEYLVKSFTIQLSHDGMMSITATKAEKNIL